MYNIYILITNVGNIVEWDFSYCRYQSDKTTKKGYLRNFKGTKWFVNDGPHHLKKKEYRQELSGNGYI